MTSINLDSKLDSPVSKIFQMIEFASNGADDTFLSIFDGEKVAP